MGVIDLIVLIFLLIPAAVLLRLGWMVFDEYCWARYFRSGRYVVRRVWRRITGFLGG